MRVTERCGDLCDDLTGEWATSVTRSTARRTRGRTALRPRAGAGFLALPRCSRKTASISCSRKRPSWALRALHRRHTALRGGQAQSRTRRRDRDRAAEQCARRFARDRTGRKLDFLRDWRRTATCSSLTRMAANRPQTPLLRRRPGRAAGRPRALRRAERAAIRASRLRRDQPRPRILRGETAAIAGRRVDGERATGWTKNKRLSEGSVFHTDHEHARDLRQRRPVIRSATVVLRYSAGEAQGPVAHRHRARKTRLPAAIFAHRPTTKKAASATF